MESDHRQAAWEMLLSEAHALAERVRKRLRDLQRRYDLPEQMLQELDQADDDRPDQADDDLPDPTAVLAPAAGSADAPKPPTVWNEPSVSPHA
jgi:hypothetical protein